MRVISLWQPHAELVARGLKQYETRGWRIDYRGPMGHPRGEKEVQPEQSQDFRSRAMTGACGERD